MQFESLQIFRDKALSQWENLNQEKTLRRSLNKPISKMNEWKKVKSIKFRKINNNFEESLAHGITEK